MGNTYHSLSAAVSWEKKKVQSEGYDIKRYLNKNSQVSFEVNKRTVNNAEFKINGNPNHLIWYSQLATIFILLDNQQFCFGELIKKGGEKVSLCDLDVEAFINYVNGKRFVVDVNPLGDVAKFDTNAFSNSISYEAARKMVEDLTKEGKFAEAARYLLPAIVYDLYEVG